MIAMPARTELIDIHIGINDVETERPSETETMKTRRYRLDIKSSQQLTTRVLLTLLLKRIGRERVHKNRKYVSLLLEEEGDFNGLCCIREGENLPFYLFRAHFPEDEFEDVLLKAIATGSSQIQSELCDVREGVHWMNDIASGTSGSGRPWEEQHSIIEITVSQDIVDSVSVTKIVD